jgi:CubicO group peptidase (beta-lactamase class C family)
MRTVRIWLLAGVVVAVAACSPAASPVASGPPTGAAAPGLPTAPASTRAAAATPSATPAAPTSIAVPSVAAPTAAPSTRASASPTGDPADAAVDGIIVLIEDHVARDEFSGVALVARGDEVVWGIAAGLADRGSGLPNRMTTRFNLGSMSKMFTAVAILQLAQQGDLSLDDTIAEVLPGYPNPDVARTVTIHQLLTHTSGLADVFTPAFNADPHAYRTNADYLPLFADEPLLFEPGTGWSYSSAGYAVLGLIIERVSGGTFDAYVREHVFEPAGMLDTAAYDVEDAVPDLAIGYTTRDIEGRETGVLTANTALMPGRGFAGGGVYSTAADLLRFRTALLSGRLLDPASTELLLVGKADMAEHVRYAYGFMERIDAGVRAVGHTGGAPGVCSFLWTYPDPGYTAIVLSNSDSGCVPALKYLRANPFR